MISFLYSFIVWNVSPEIFNLDLKALSFLPFDHFSLRWYGLLFASGFLIGQQILIKIYKQEGKTIKDVDTLTVYMFIATVVGARLGHCLFYQPDYFLKHPLEILYIWEGGLASHGATVGILIAIYIYSKKQTDQSYMYVLDRLVIVIALAGCLIRTGNLMNSEVYGKQTNQPQAFVFVNAAQTEIQERYSDFLKDVRIHNTGKDTLIGDGSYVVLDLSFSLIDRNAAPATLASFTETEIREQLLYSQSSSINENILVLDGPLSYAIQPKGNDNVVHVKMYGIPRHPTQIYEAVVALLLFLLLYFIYDRYREKTPEGRIFGLFVFILFTFRFVVEYLKAPQVAFENEMALNMGQLLSIPMIVAGVFILIRSFRNKGEIS